MGMDMYLLSAYSKKDFGNDAFWKEFYETPNDYCHPQDLYYSRKFWDLYNNLSFTKEYECGDYLLLTKENVEEMLNVSCHNRDYFDGFSTVPQLCEVLAHWDEMQEYGLNVFFECDW